VRAVFPTDTEESAAIQCAARSSLRNRGQHAGIAVAIVWIEHAMTRATVYLLVLIMTSLPAASAVCVTWCESQPASTTVHCHRQESPAISSAQGACAALKDSPFVRQDVRIALNAALGLALAVVPDVSGPHEEISLVIADNDARSAPPQRSLVLRL
jgi:hypothetical protein